MSNFSIYIINLKKEEDTDFILVYWFNNKTKHINQPPSHNINFDVFVTQTSFWFLSLPKFQFQ